MASLSAESLVMAPHADADARPQPTAQQQTLLATASSATGMSPDELRAFLMTLPGLQRPQPVCLSHGDTLMSVGSSDSLVDAVLLAQSLEESVPSEVADDPAATTLASPGEAAAPPAAEVPLPPPNAKKCRA